jgi:hypothetical protein
VSAEGNKRGEGVCRDLAQLAVIALLCPDSSPMARQNLP